MGRSDPDFVNSPDRRLGKLVVNMAFPSVGISERLLET
jgi:hypothetical protein